MTHAAAPQSFLRTYVFSVDHKMIAKQYLFTGFAMAILGGLLAMLFRTQLAWPNQPIPGYGMFADGGVMPPEQYNALVTMHGTIMVFWVAMPILISAFGNFLIPLMVGAEDMAFPKLNLLSYWVFLTSTIVLLASFLVPAGAFAAGWTAYPPLSARPGFTGVGLGTQLWILAVALEFASMLLGGVNFLTTVANCRAPGMSFWRLPMLVWMQLIASLVFMFSVGPLIGGALMLLLDSTFGTSFFVPTGGGDPLLFQHLFWFFGHPEVYVILLPALGIVAEVIPAFSRKPLFGYRMMIWSTIAAGLLSFVVWAHHQFVSGINPALAFPFSFMTILISVPFAITIFAMIATLWRGSHQFTTAMLWAVGMIAEFLVGGVTGIINGSAAADIYVHDTYYVVAHFHYTLFPAVIYGMMAGLFYWFPKMFGRHLDERMGKAHFWLTTIAFNLVFIPLFYVGLGGHHRRISDPSVFPLLAPLMRFHLVATYATAVLLLAQFILVFNVFRSMFRGAIAERNPWKANTLEWAAPSPPPHGNFDRPVAVYRGPYEFSVPGEAQDWLPQDAVPTKA